MMSNKTLIYDLSIAAMSCILAVALWRMPRRYRRLEQRGVRDRSALLLQLCRIALVNFALPAVVLYLYLEVPAWGVINQLQPDLSYWLIAVAVILVCKGLWELAL